MRGVNNTTLRPYLCMLVGSFAFAWMGILAHEAGKDYDWQIIAIVRCSIPLAIVGTLALSSGTKLVFLRPRSLWMRSVSGSLSLVRDLLRLAAFARGGRLHHNQHLPHLGCPSLLADVGGKADPPSVALRLVRHLRRRPYPAAASVGRQLRGAGAAGGVGVRRSGDDRPAPSQRGRHSGRCGALSHGRAVFRMGELFLDGTRADFLCSGRLGLPGTDRRRPGRDGRPGSS